MEFAHDLAGVIRVSQPSPLSGADFDSFYRFAGDGRGDDPILRIAQYLRVFVDEPQRLLFTGHSGCGKSTEMYRLSRQIDDSFWTVTFSVFEHLDPNDVSHIDLILVIIERLADAAQKAGLSIQQLTARAIVNWLKENLKGVVPTLEGVDVSVGLGSLLGTLVDLKATIKFSKDTKHAIVKRLEPRLSQLLDQCNLFIDSINSQLSAQGKRLLVTIEDLDKLSQPLARELFLDHAPTLLGPKCHMIYTVPISMIYSPDIRAVRDKFHGCEILPMIKVYDRQRQPYDKGVTAVETILDARMEPRLLQEEARRELIAHTGGCLRDVFDVLQSAALEALRRGADQITLSNIGFGLRQKRNSLERSLTERSEGGAVQVTIQQYYAKLAAVANDPLRKPDNDRVLMDLLYNRTVLEYDGGDRWCDVHPLVLDLLREKGLVNSDTGKPRPTS